jgi:hypothetical protein
MQCKCGSETPEGAKFCPTCGKKIPKPKPKPSNIPDVPEQLLIRVVDPILRPVEAARLLKISRWKLDELRIQGKLPGNCYFEIPSESEVKRMYRYRAKELLAWLGITEHPITTAS